MKAMIAMSGGVDSSVCAVLTQQQGYDCVAVHMKLHPENADVYGQKCGSPTDVRDASLVAQALGIPFYAHDYSKEFDHSVVCPFVQCYERGLTPNPCIECNRTMKFGHLYEKAREMDCDKVVTGHYARIEFDGNRYLLKRAKNKAKDQSYVLYFLTQQQLSRTLFPLGEFESKEAVRTLAKTYGFENADRPDSQDICFVPDGDYAAFITRKTGKKYPKGNFVDPTGKVLGEHKGLIGYTIGQRRGLGLALAEPGYVVSKDMEKNEIVVAPRSFLMTDTLLAGALNWIAFDTPPKTFRAGVCTRYQAPEAMATVTIHDDNTLSVLFDEPQRKAAAGQSVVFYDGDTVLGGGIIL